MKRIAFILCLTIVASILASCGGATAHVHQYDDKWSSDAEGHWHEAICNCENAEPTKVDHVDKNNDGACDACEFTDHTHTYAETWTADSEYHWHAANCGHVVPGENVEAHEDSNGDGECDTCLLVIDSVHEHIYASGWSYDLQYHWHDTLCEHCSEVSEKEAHNIDAAGYCTVCNSVINDIDMDNIEAVLLAAVARDHMVNGGKIMYRHELLEKLEDGSLVREGYIYNDIYFVLGNNCSYFNYITVFDDDGATPNDSLQYWTELDDNPATEDVTEVFCAGSEDGGATILPFAGDPDKLYGYNYTPGSIVATYDDNSSLAKVLYNIYQVSKMSTVTDLVAKYDAKNEEYVLSYNYLSVNASTGNSDFTSSGSGNGDGGNGSQISYSTSYYTVTVKFSVNADMIIESADFTVDVYRTGDEVLDDADYTYDPITGEINWNDRADPTRYQYKVSQTSGEKTYTAPYSKATLVPKKFDIMYDGEVIHNSITLEAGYFVYFSLGNLYPATANNNFIVEAVRVSIFNNTAGEYLDDWLYFVNTKGEIGFMPKEGQQYTMTVTINDMTKSIIIVTDDPTPVDINPYIFTKKSYMNDTWYDVSYQVDDDAASGPKYTASVGVGEKLYFTALISPDACTQNFSVSCSSNKVTLSEEVLTDAMVFGENLSVEDGNAYTAQVFTASAKGTYTVVITCDEDPSITTTLTVTVK